MSKAKNEDDLRPEYDFASIPSEAAVNEALRGVLSTTRAVRRSGSLPNKTLQPTSRTRRRAKKSSKKARSASSRRRYACGRTGA